MTQQELIEKKPQVLQTPSPGLGLDPSRRWHFTPGLVRVSPMSLKCIQTAVLTLSIASSSAVGFAKGVRAHMDAPVTFQGVADASAAVAVAPHFFVTASDEECQLRIYDRDKGGDPLSLFNLAPHLLVHGHSHELDLEGAAAVGNRLYWISSQSRNREGQRRTNREQFFAVDVTVTNDLPRLSFVGHASDRFFEQLCLSDVGKKYGLAAASQESPRSREGLNIEGMCNSADGGLWIGFRSPNPENRALLIHLDNPADVVRGKPARFGKSVTLDLDGLGIRDMVYDGKRFFLVAGAHGGKNKARLYKWDGASESPRLLKLPGLAEINPEAVAVFSSQKPESLYVFTDGGRDARGPFASLRPTFDCYRIELDPK